MSVMKLIALALIPGAVVGGLAVLAARDGISLYDIVWLAWGLLFWALEAYGILSAPAGDTLSERFREWFRTDTVLGKVMLSVTLLCFVGWFIPHLIFGGKV